MTELAHNIPAYSAEVNPHDMMSWPDKYNPVTSKNGALPEILTNEVITFNISLGSQYGRNFRLETFHRMIQSVNSAFVSIQVMNVCDWRAHHHVIDCTL
jgi:hypothetical protein